jgi:hypothetical protein
MTARTQTKPLRWILNGPAVQTFAQDPGAQKFFAGSSPFVVQRKDGAVALPVSWKAIPTRTFTSYGALQKAFATGAIGPDVKAILYDNEAWQFTPMEEQTNFGDYSQRVAQLVHAHGLLLINAPAVDLVRNLASASEKRYDAYIRLGIARDGAKDADVFEIQAQGSEMATARFAEFVSAAAGQARQANPKVLVLAGISTNPSGRNVSADQIVRAIDATRGVVDGYWFNVPAPSDYCPQCNAFRPDLALEVLRGI